MTEWNLSPEAARIAQQLRQRGGLSHAYILSAPPGSDREALVSWMTAAWVCTGPGQAPCGTCAGCRKALQGIHPDIIRAGGDGPVNVAAVRELRADAYIRPNEAPGKVYVIDGAQDMNASAQNALLKVLEEGPAYAAFLLLAEHAAALLPTIRSRCEVLRLTSLPAPPQEGLAETAQTLARLLIEGSELELAEFGVSLEKWERGTFGALLDQTLDNIRTALVEGGGDRRRLMALAGHLDELRQASEFNIGTGHLAGWLAAGGRILSF